MALSPQFGSIIPSQVQEALASNFLSFNGGANPGDSDSFAQQYLPEIYEAEVERYGNRTLSGLTVHLLLLVLVLLTQLLSQLVLLM
jgi:hypothetical protein